MATSAAFASTLRIPGTSTVMTDEACTAVSATVFQITNTAKRVLNPGVALTVKANLVTQLTSAYTVDPLFGRVTFAVAPTAPVTISGSYFPMLDIADVFEVSISESMNVIDTSVFSTAGVKTKILGLADLSGSLTGLNLFTFDNDPGAGTVALGTIYAARTPTLLEVRPGGVGDFYRAWVVLTGTDGKLPADGRFEGSVMFSGVLRDVNGEPGEQVAAGWGQ